MIVTEKTELVQKKVEVMEVRKIFTSNDGHTFRDEQSCLFHEWEVHNIYKVWVVYSVELSIDEYFSTKSLALEFIKINNSNNCKLTPRCVHLDKFFWDK